MSTFLNTIIPTVTFLQMQLSGGALAQYGLGSGSKAQPSQNKNETGSHK